MQCWARPEKLTAAGKVSTPGVDNDDGRIPIFKGEFFPGIFQSSVVVVHQVTIVASRVFIVVGCVLRTAKSSYS